MILCFPLIGPLHQMNRRYCLLLLTFFQVYSLPSLYCHPGLGLHGPCYFYLECYTNLLTAVSTSYHSFFTPAHLKIAGGFICLKYTSVHVTPLSPSCLRIKYKPFTLAFKAFLDLPPANSTTIFKGPTLQPQGSTRCSWSSSPQHFGHQGLVSWEMIFPRTGGWGGGFIACHQMQLNCHLPLTDTVLM